jgi:hypothetical protein
MNAFFGSALHRVLCVHASSGHPFAFQLARLAALASLLHTSNVADWDVPQWVCSTWQGSGAVCAP